MRVNMAPASPTSPEEVASLLKDAASASRSISIIGNESKRLMAGPGGAADVAICTRRLNRILHYEPNDLTISAEAGVRWADLQHELIKRGQTVALDPPFSQSATVGGVVSSNSSGPCRARFGTSRDLVIGMQFAMLDGKLVRAGGMVVKNVAGLDIGKLMIGSFGTLAVVTSVNFRLHTLPAATNTFLLAFPDLDNAIRQRDAVLASFLRPIAVDLLTLPAAARLDRRGYLLAIRAGGSPAVLERYARELSGSERLVEKEDEAFWKQVREFPCDFLGRQAGGVILRVSTPLNEIGTLLHLVSGLCISRAASGVTHVYLNSPHQIAGLWEAVAQHGWPAVVEFAPDQVRQTRSLWLSPRGKDDSSFAMMKSIKQMFDPENLLNRSRLYGRI
jgi:glycolate dehydrogenase FAD-binding subunit